jgi:hypothetical protein
MIYNARCDNASGLPWHGDQQWTLGHAAQAAHRVRDRQASHRVTILAYMTVSSVHRYVRAMVSTAAVKSVYITSTTQPRSSVILTWQRKRHDLRVGYQHALSKLYGMPDAPG